MRTVLLGTVASLLSALTALVVIRAGESSLSPLWLLLAQYVVGLLMSPPRSWPTAPIRLHAIRLVYGLWAFGAYYFALARPGASAIELSMILNAAPILVTFHVTRDYRARAGSLLAFLGVALTLRPGLDGLPLSASKLLAATAAVAYASSFVVLGALSASGERATTTNGLYNASAGLVVLLIVLVIKPKLPGQIWPILAVGFMAALRIQVITAAAISSRDSAIVSTLTNLSFFWLAGNDFVVGNTYDAAKWMGLALVATGIGLTPLRGTR